MRTNVYRDGKVHVCAERCSTCIFHPGNRMQLQRGRVKDMVDQCLADGGVIPCHQTLSEYDPANENQNVCRGFYDVARVRKVPVFLLAIALDMVEFT